MRKPNIKITEEIINKAKKFASQGLTQQQIADALGWGTTSLYKYLSENTKFANAIKEGQAQGIEKVANALFKTAIKGNTAAQIFYLKNRAGWADKQELDVTSETKTKIGFDDFYTDHPKGG